MSFEENLWSTFIGTLLAFLFGIIAFYLTEKIRNKTFKKHLTKAFKKEIEYNHLLINQQASILSEAIDQIVAGSRPINLFFNLRNFQRSLLDQYYFHGHAHDSFEPIDILTCSSVCDYVSSPSQDYINNLLRSWNENNHPQDIAQKLINERNYLQKMISSYNDVYLKLE